MLQWNGARCSNNTTTRPAAGQQTRQCPPMPPNAPQSFTSHLFPLAGVPCTRAPSSSASGFRRCRSVQERPVHSFLARAAAAWVRLRPWWQHENHPTLSMTVSVGESLSLLVRRPLGDLEDRVGPGEARARVRGLAQRTMMNGCHD